MRQSTTQRELAEACALTARACSELFNGYLPLLEQLTKIARGDAAFDKEKMGRFREALTPVAGRAAYALRYADEVSAGVIETVLRPPDDPRVPAPLLRAMLESVLAALAVSSAEELTRVPLASRRLMRELLEEPLMKLWMAQHLS
jgi:hypothetical protein